MANFTQDFFTSRRNIGDGNVRIGERDRLWYDPITNTIRIGDGTAGGKIVGNTSTESATETFETVNKNLKSYPSTLTYTGGSTLTQITYTTPNGVIQKTLNYSNGLLTSIVLSGNTPNNISLIKTLNYSNGKIVGITYS